MTHDGMKRAGKMSGIYSWIQKKIYKIQEQKYFFCTDPISFRLIKSYKDIKEKYDGKNHSIQIETVDDCFIEYSLDGNNWFDNQPKLIEARRDQS